MFDGGRYPYTLAHITYLLHLYLILFFIFRSSYFKCSYLFSPAYYRFQH